MPVSENISNVISTGGGGTVFEHQVGGSFLCLVLTGSYIPIFPNAIASNVHFQARRLGWNIDDLVVEAIANGTTRHVIAAQIKRTFTVSETDKDCCKTFLAAWLDFQATDRFNPSHDAFALIVHLGTNRLLNDFGWLLAQARTSTSAQDFEQRRLGEGVLNKQSKKDYNTIKSILEKETDTAIPNDALWKFLRVFHLISYDLTSPSAKDEHWFRMLLTITATEGDPVSSASSTWAELVKLASEKAPHGASCARSDLPAALVRRHRMVSATEHHSITSARQHSDVVLARVFDTAANNFSFQRTSIAEKIAKAASSNQVVLIVGAAGSGKSVLAKRFIHSLSGNEFTIVFAAEEFRVPHIDSVLTNANIGVNWATMRSLLCMQPSKTFLIEGLERLLETDDRNALIDLLRTVADDPTIRLIITCRDYHSETVERTMLRPSGISFERVVIPGLTDEELSEAIKIVPSLEWPLSSPPLRRLLRNPFALVRAAEVAWQKSAALPATEKTLRERLWGDIVRKDAYPGDGMPSRRAATMTNIALARARSLRPYVEVSSFDHQVTHVLATDNLLAFDSSAHLRAAPAHDVFEDWALIEWLSAQFLQCDGDAIRFASARDAHPALRRVYRKWLHEVIETDSAIANTYLTAIATTTSIPEYLRDDTMIAVFQSSAAADFLSTFAATLLENEGQLLQRVIHLVRVACKTVSPLANTTPIAHQWHVPAGSAWPNMLEFLVQHWERLSPSFYPLIISFLEDWAQGVSWVTPYPDGFESAGKLLHELLPLAAERGRGNSQKHRVIKLMTRIPKAVEATFKDLAERRKRLKKRREDVDAEILGDLLQKPFEAFAAARDFPQEVMGLCQSIWKLKPSEQNNSYYSGLREVDSVFGIEEHLHYSFFPASAMQGPFQALLKYHPNIAIPFIVSLMNEAADHYGHARTPLQYVEPPSQIDLHFPDGASTKIWINSRLWNAYRATSVIPYVLGSALMALERWLLEMIQVAEFEPYIQKWLVWILQHSNNVSPIAVVASVCIANPAKAIDASQILLSCKDLFDLDRQRMVADYGALAPGGLDHTKQMLQKERIASNKLPHRRQNLENLALNAQLIDRDKVWTILDKHLADLPPLDQQNDEDRLWRLALSRMDLRKYETVDAANNTHIEIQMRQPDPDIQEVIDRRIPEQEKYSQGVSLFLWATKQYERNEKFEEAKDEWHDRLEQAQIELQEDRAPELLGVSMFNGGPGIVAAVCVRDHWGELGDKEKQWCVETTINYVMQKSIENSDHEFMAKSPMNGVPACANVLPLIHLKLEPDILVTRALITALLHFNEDTRFEAVKGVSEHVVAQDPRLAAFCAWVLMSNTKIMKDFEECESKMPHNKRTPFMHQIMSARHQVTETIEERWYESYPDFQRIGFGSWAERHMARALIYLFRQHAELPEAYAYFSRLAAAIKTWWRLDSRRNDSGEQYDFDLEYEAKDAIAAFLLDCPASSSIELSQSLICTIEEMPDKVADLLQSMLIHEDRRTSSSNYWQFWSAVANKVLTAPWLSEIDCEHSDGQPLIRECFLNTRWREGIETWDRLGVNFKKIDQLFERLPASSFTLECYVHYLYHIGHDSLPEAFILISKKFGDALGAAIASGSDIRWYLDALISRLMFDDLVSLKKDAKLRAGVMTVLDSLVHAGSSAAFQLRDDFVTPYTGTT